MRKIKLRHITYAFLILLSIQNSINLIYQGNTRVLDYLLYAGLFLVAAIVIMVLEHVFNGEHVHGWTYVFFGLVTDAIGSTGNMTSVLLYCFGLYFLHTVKHSFSVVLVASVLAFFLRAYFAPMYVTSIFNELLARSYFMLVFYRYIYPQPARIEHIEGLTDLETQIVQYLIQGMTVQEMQPLLTSALSIEAINKRKYRLRVRFGVRTDAELVWLLSKTGRIRPHF